MAEYAITHFETEVKVVKSGGSKTTNINGKFDVR